MAAVIIPAWNEAPRVAGVVSAALAARRASRVVVADDGSTDGTAEEAAAAGAEVLRLPHRGKGAAVAAAAAQAEDPVLVLLDADLGSLRPEHVDALAAPVEDGEADMTLGLLPAHWLNPRGVQLWQSGQRGVWAEDVRSLRAEGYGLEIELTGRVQGRGGRIAQVELDGVTIPNKYQKWGLATGLLAGARMRVDQVQAAASTFGAPLLLLLGGAGAGLLLGYVWGES